MKPRILSIDTSGAFGSLALTAGEEIVEELPLHSPDGFGQILFGALESLLNRHGWRVAEIDCYAAGTGPGSFTGVRIALAAAKGLAASYHRPLVGVSNLRALAASGSGPMRAPLLDARRGEIYGGLYGAELDRLADEVVMPLPDFLARLPDADVELIAQDFTLFEAALAGSRYAALRRQQAPRAMAASIARIAARSYAAGLTADPALVDANYVRRSDAERFWVDR